VSQAFQISGIHALEFIVKRALPDTHGFQQGTQGCSGITQFPEKARGLLQGFWVIKFQSSRHSANLRDFVSTAKELFDGHCSYTILLRLLQNKLKGNN
jgi:hypothetical protein